MIWIDHSSIKFRRFLLLVWFIFKCSVHELRNGFSFDTNISHSIRIPNFNLENISLNLFIFQEYSGEFLRSSLPNIHQLTAQNFILNLNPSIFAFHAQFNTRIVYFWDFDVWERKWIINFEIAPYFFALFCVLFYVTDSDSGLFDKAYAEKWFGIPSS